MSIDKSPIYSHKHQQSEVALGVRGGRTPFPYPPPPQLMLMSNGIGCLQLLNDVLHTYKHTTHTHIQTVYR